MEHDDVSGAGAQASELQEEKEEAPSYSSPPAAGTTDDAPPEPEAAAGDAEETEAGTIEVNLKFIHHDRVSLRCSPQIHVAELKERVVAEVEHVSSAAEGAGASESTANLRLIYKGKVLKDDQTLASYHFQDGDTLHAVFGRPNTASASPEAAPAVAPEPTTPPMTSSGMQDMGNGVVMGSFEMETGMPDIGGLINSMLAGFGGAGPGAASIHIATTDVPNTSTANDGGVRATTAGSSNSADTRTSPAATSTTTSPRATTVTPTPLATGTAATSRSSNMRNIADVTDQVSTLRRMMPPLELGSLSRPPDLDPELYALGNAVRDASDTFLAMHRQMQFLSTRLLHEHLLSERDRARLRARVQHVIPAMYTVGALSNSVGESLESSRYGPGSGGDTSEATTGRTPSIPFARPVPQDQRPVGDGSGASRTYQQGPSLGDSIADVLRVVSGVTTGLANMTTSRSQAPPAPMGPPRGPTRPPTAVPQEEPRGMSDFMSMLASFEPSAPPRATVPRRPAPEIDGSRSGPPTIPERPLAALLIEVRVAFCRLD
ncbi:hypothetical protein BBJ28_00020168 [Nothophytophthora sp. Chile5]|nr:hypothetical protein BBJ28_00020168 [Nothophytophthora sp. Chile5]